MQGRSYIGLIAAAVGTALIAAPALGQGGTPAAVTNAETSADLGSLDLDPRDLEGERDGWRFTGFYVWHQNDGSIIEPLDDDDRHYSAATKIELTFDPDFDAETREFLAPADKWPDAKLAFGVVLAQHIYTSSDIQDRDPPAGDRPYAGYLYAGAFLQRRSGNVHDHFELDVGVVGSWSLAEDAQRAIHGLPGQYEPQGWGTQLANELAINLRVQRSWKSDVAQIGGDGGLELDAIPRLGFDVGNVFIRANTDVTVRLGKHIPDDFGPGRLLDYRDATGSWSEEHGWGAYVYGRVGMRAVGRNIFLEGNTFANSRSTSPERLVGEVEIGVRARFDLFGGDLVAGYGWTMNTHEYKGQGDRDTLGSVMLGWTKRF
ncbi:MAG: membrane protein [Phycisphaeraceae bacterium]|nr:MAG: membrane protein [Phycisphaeraceae bacterium]